MPDGVVAGVVDVIRRLRNWWLALTRWEYEPVDEEWSNPADLGGDLSQDYDPDDADSIIEWRLN